MHFGWRALLAAYAAEPGPRERLRTALSASDCVVAVRCVAMGSASGDELCDRLMRLFRLDPPSETELRRLSTLQQRSAGTGGTEEYATLTVWLCAIESIVDRELRRRRRRPASETAPTRRVRSTRPRRAHSA
jgi:hypothetical protein